MPFAALLFPSAQSPSMRREWIEMIDYWDVFFDSLSPSMRREWIEIATPRCT